MTRDNAASGVGRAFLLLVALAGAASIAAAAESPFLQTKTPYRPQQDAGSYEAPPPGFTPIFTEFLARHGSRGLSSPKSDLAAYALWKKAEEDDALTDLGRGFGAEALKIIKANALLGYHVEGITKPGYGNESQLGIQEHTELAHRLLARLPGFWRDVTATQKRQIVVVTSGVDRAVDSGVYFVRSLTGALPDLTKLVAYPPAPWPYPAAAPVKRPDGTDRFVLYFHKLTKSEEVTDPNDPLYPTYRASLVFQDYVKRDADLKAKIKSFDRAPGEAAGRAVLMRLFTPAFVDKVADGTLRVTNKLTLDFVSDDGKFKTTIAGNGKTSIRSLADAGAAIYDLYSIAPALRAEAGADFSPYMPAEAAQAFAYEADFADFYEKGPGIAEKGEATYAVAQILLDDFFNEVDAVAQGDLSHAAKLRFAHAETVMPFVSRLGLKEVLHPLPLAATYRYDNDPWRGETVSPMAANVQWDVYRADGGRLLVKMLYNERETDFKAGCDGARVGADSHYYDYAKLAGCYGHKPAR
jgi:hypothetical protein